MVRYTRRGGGDNRDDAEMRKAADMAEEDRKQKLAAAAAAANKDPDVYEAEQASLAERLRDARTKGTLVGRRKWAPAGVALPTSTGRAGQPWGEGDPDAVGEGGRRRRRKTRSTRARKTRRRRRGTRRSRR